jgi:trehalose-6-phosphatase
MFKPTIVLDFDGVLHSYKSGWKGATNIPDPPVEGALEFLVGALDRFNVAILSSRSHQWGGRRAMKRWLRSHLIAEAGADYSSTPEWWRNRIAKTAFADPWKDEVEWAASEVVREIKWPLFKPAAHFTIDDRAHQFDGTWPGLSYIASFKPWNKRVPA